MPIELKTGHIQSPSQNHLAQLSTYTIMLRARHGSSSSFSGIGTNRERSNNDSLLDDMETVGAASSGMLLYLNHENVCARHVKPSMSEVATLIGQRNSVASNVRMASRPRGVGIEYEDGERKVNGRGRGGDGGLRLVEDNPPPIALPGLLPSANTCERCYKNRECMMYASSTQLPNDRSTALSGTKKHERLLKHFTGHLKGADLEYFRKWDRLIDLERHASVKDVVSKSWLFESGEKEAKDGKCISSLVLDEAALAAALRESETAAGRADSIDDGDEDASIRFVRSNESAQQAPLTNLVVEVGSYVILSEDGAASSARSSGPKDGLQLRGAAVRNRMHILRGSVVSIGENSIDIAVRKKDALRLKRIYCSSHAKTERQTPTFRLDKDEFGNSVGLLLQNLINFFT